MPGFKINDGATSLSLSQHRWLRSLIHQQCDFKNKRMTIDPKNLTSPTVFNIGDFKLLLILTIYPNVVSGVLSFCYEFGLQKHVV